MFSPSEVRQLVRLVTTRTGNPVLDEDLVQEAFLRAFDAFRRAGHVEYPRAFLRKVVLDTVRDHWRRTAVIIDRRVDMDALDERFVSFQPHFEDDLDRRRRMAVVRAAISQLDESKRRVLQLFYEEDLSVLDIARLDRCSVSSVKMQLLRARRQLERIVRTKLTKKSR